MRTIDNFCGQENGYSRSITLRNRLIPIGKTEEKLKELKLLEDDYKRAGAYVEVKKLIDDFHRSFINDVLKDEKLNWKPLYDLIEKFQKADKDAKLKIRDELSAEQKKMRNSIVKCFTNDERYGKLFKKDLLEELLPPIIESSSDEDIKNRKEALEVFNKFSTYFTGFHENRKNIYSADEKSTAISYRIVNENFPKFISNIKVYEYLEENYPDIIKKTEESLSLLLRGRKLKEIFSIEGFNKVLSQSGIDVYNTVIGGITEENGAKKVQGLNEIINLTQQQLPKEEKNKLKKKMVVLYKQILSDRTTASFIPEGFVNSHEVYESLKDFNKNVVEPQIRVIKNLYSEKTEYDNSKVYVPSKSLTNFSQTVFGGWSILSDGLFLLLKGEKELSEKKSFELHNKINKMDFSLKTIQEAYNEWVRVNNIDNPISINSYFVPNRDIIDSIEKLYDEINFDSEKNLQQEKDAATPIKAYLDSVQNLYHYMKLVDYKGEEEKDSSFYEEYDKVLEELSNVIPLYNKIRNFVTKKIGEVKKIKLNFNCPTLANGWDANKEKDNDAILMLKDGKYYLGIFNPKSKPNFTELEDPSNSATSYKKMVYKLLPGPNKMLPKVFFSKKGKEIYNPPEEILNGYKEGKFKKGDTFDLDFCHKLIDWYKSAIKLHPDWSKFNFKFSDTSSYEDISGFFREIESQGYKITYVNIPEDKVNKFIDEGKLFLFQVYNKDFATKATGKKNMHTLYFENLFSEENLKKVVFKLNGEAELFYRPSTPDMKIIKHTKGSILINKTTKDGKTIEDDIYQEIYKFKNNKLSTISDKAKALLDSGNVICKTATHEIIKDKHFTHDTYLFHCPITMNFNSPEITGKKFNDRVLDLIKDKPDVKIIGLDRGERHLIYLSLINQKGEIELQKTLNLVNQVRNDKIVEVNYQEKLVKKEGDRDNARKNWQTIGNIKELKEGYLSNIVHEIAKLMIENNAIVVMEDLNFGFKRGRFAVERQVYQKFENMLIDKLNYLVFKDRDITSPGGVLNAYQLTDKAVDVKDVGKQCGWLFYIPAAYTSKIDPKTGFVNLFNTKGLTNIEKKKAFFDKFDSIRYDKDSDSFIFTFNYDNFETFAESYKKNWNIYTVGERIKYSPKNKDTYTVIPTKMLKELFDNYNIPWISEDNLMERINEIQAEKTNAKFFDTLYQAFTATLQMRNSVPNTDKDYLISPIKSDDGTFYNSDYEKNKGTDAKLPIDADANGAYHIAMKGLYLLKNNFNRNNKGYIENISNKEWFKFIQKKEY